ncbi:hypothetical protein Tco_1291043, partial [Tanacetum coccineum]
AYQTFDDMLKKFDRDNLDKLWSLVKERFSSTNPTDDKERALWVELKRLFEPDIDDIIWKLQRYIHDTLTWRLYDTCGVHHVSTDRGHDIFMLVEKDYPLTRGILTLMLCNKLQVDQYLEMANELLKKIFILVNHKFRRGLLGIKGFYKFLLLVQLNTAKRRLSTTKLSESVLVVVGSVPVPFSLLVDLTIISHKCKQANHSLACIAKDTSASALQALRCSSSIFTFSLGTYSVEVAEQKLKKALARASLLQRVELYAIYFVVIQSKKKPCCSLTTDQT